MEFFKKPKKSPSERMVLVDVLADPSRKTGNEELLEGEHDNGEEHDESNAAQSIATLKQIFEDSSPMSLRHRQAPRNVEKRLEKNARLQEWHRQAYGRRQQQLVTRRVTREHAELLLEDATDPLPTPIIKDLADFRRQSL